MLENKIAVFDVLRSCEIRGSADASIKAPEPNDLTEILQTADIRAIAANGKKAGELYRRYCKEAVERPALCLPSTSPANAGMTIEKLIGAWKVLLEYLKE